MSATSSRKIFDLSKLVDTHLDAETLSNIGHIAILGAKLDDALSLLIFHQTGTNYADGHMMIGRSAISAKFEMADSILKRRQDTSLYKDFRDMKKLIIEFSEIRNTLCHGVYMGMLPDTDTYVFLRPADQLSPLRGVSIVKSCAISKSSIRDARVLAASSVAVIGSMLGGKSSREIHIELCQRGHNILQEPDEN